MLTRIALLLFIVIQLSSCSQSGIQGTALFSSFQGLEKAEPVSPTSIKLSWSLDSKYTSYNIYLNQAVTPIKEETFSSTTLTGLLPGTTYSFKVTGVKLDSSEEVVGGNLSATTLTPFSNLSSGGVVLKSSTEVGLKWSMNGSSVTYKVFKKKQSGTWNLNSPDASLLGENQQVVSGLSPGETYCFFVQAHYTDGTVEPLASTEALINALAPCVRLTSNMANLPSVTVGSTVPGPFAWFWSANGDPSYKTDVYELDTDILIGSRIGNGVFRSFTKESEGEKNYYALVSKGSEVARVEVDRFGKTTKKSTKIRVMDGSSSKGSLFPPLMSGGFGRQNFGSQVASGDFNCDGLMDLAVSAPNAVLEPTPQHYVDSGMVVVYFSYQSPGPCFDTDGVTQLPSCPIEFKTDLVPSTTNTYPNPILITYPATQNQMQFGVKLAIGNFNGDCFNRSSVPSERLGGGCNNLFISSTLANRPSIKSCDDLVIGTSASSFYVVYGDPVKGLTTGSGASTAGENEFTCEEVSNSCRVVRMTLPSGYKAGLFGKVFTAGDFNNDGYDEIATSAERSTGVKTDVLIYRGNPRGLYPYGASGSHAKISGDTYNSVSMPSGSMISSSIDAPDLGSTDKFGVALATAFDSRLCENGSPTNYIFKPDPPLPTLPLSKAKGYDFSKCDDMVIGSPGRASNRGSIFSCKADTGTNSQTIVKWECAEHYPSTLAANSGYGTSLLGAKNHNAYPIQNMAGTGALPNIAGAVFVGAPTETIGSVNEAGAVYGYYITPSAAGSANSYTSGGISGILGPLGHTIGADNQVACDRYNANGVDFSGMKRCLHQRITMPQVESYAHFGAVLSSIPKKSGAALSEESFRMLAVAAPDRTISSSNGSGSIARGGSIFLFRPDFSTFGTDPVGGPIAAPHYNVSCPYGGTCEVGTTGTWYSGGVSPFGPTVIYPNNLMINSYFGSGGVVGGNFNGDVNEETDVISSAPGLGDPTSENGAVYLFTSRDGFAPVENAPTQTLKIALGLEGGYRFEEGKAAGDINGDGYEDLVAHVNGNGKWSLIVYYGSSNGLIKSATPSKSPSGLDPLLINLSTDSSFGSIFFPAGDVNGDGFADVFAVGSAGSYLYYGSSAGLVSTQTPSVSPIGKGALLFAAVGGSINLSSMGTLSGPTDSSYNTALSGFSSGDFNKDGFGDMAIRFNSSIAPATGLDRGNLNFNSNQWGRVVVIYGSQLGPQVNRLTGKITVSTTSNLNDVVTVSPCTLDIFNNSICKIQLLGPPHTGSTSKFGFSIATTKTKNSSQYHASYDRLLISDLDDAATSQRGAVYLFEGGLTGLDVDVKQTLVGPSDADEFGMQILTAGDINGDFYDDVVISDKNRIYSFYGNKDISGIVAYYGDSSNSISNTDYWHSNPTSISLNDQNAGVLSPRPQMIRPTSLPSTDLFGWGLASLGDFNNDGFNDVAVNIPNGDSTLYGTVTAAGSVVVFFGSEVGLKVKSLNPSAYPRCYGGASPICEPYQVFMPDAVANENTTIHPYSAADFNGDGYKDLIVGVTGRDLIVPSMRTATSTGALFFLY